MTYDLPMDENLRGLLVELAEQPERALLSTRVRRFSDLLRPDVEVLRPTTGMGVIEAKLLEAYREELAHALLQTSRARHESQQRVILSPRDIHGVASPLANDAIQARSMCLLSSTLARAHPPSALDALRSVTQGDHRPVPTPKELAVASLRLAPRTETRIWLGVYVGAEGDHTRSIELHRSAISDSTSAFLASYAWSNISSNYNSLRRFNDATEAARAAAHSQPSMGRGALTWLLSSIQSGVRSEVLNAASAVTSTLTEHSEELAENVGYLRTTRSLGVWSPTRQSSQVIASLGSELSPTAERIIETFI